MPRRRALVVGIDHYDNYSQLRCAINDARRISPLLNRNDDGSLNYEVRELISAPASPVTTKILKQALVELFDGFDGDILFFFSGHGAQTPWGGYLVTQDGADQQLGVSMEDVLLLANRSRAREVVIIVDCCHSGDLGNPPILQGSQPLALLREGITIIAASRPNQPAFEAGGHGMFSDALSEGLAGGAADHMGNVDTSSLFLYAERLFGPWDQRPMYKSHKSNVSTLRTCKPPVPAEILRSIRTYFDSADGRLRLDPEYELEVDPNDDNLARAKKRQDSRNFKRLRDARLLESVDGDDLYWTAMNSREIRLTNLGKYFWKLLDIGKI